MKRPFFSLLGLAIFALTACSGGGDALKHPDTCGATSKYDRCKGNVAQRCASGLWQDLADCATSGEVCKIDPSTEEAICTTSCVSGERCQGTARQSCDPTLHFWVPVEYCEYHHQTCQEVTDQQGIVHTICQ